MSHRCKFNEQVLVLGDSAIISSGARIQNFITWHQCALLALLHSDEIGEIVAQKRTFPVPVLWQIFSFY